MAIKIEERIDELCNLAAGEQNYTKLKSVMSNFSNASTPGNGNAKRRTRFRFRRPIDLLIRRQAK